MSSIAEVRTTVDGHLNEMEQGAATIMSLNETLGASAHGIRAAVGRASGHSSYVSETEALFGPVVAIIQACEALSGAIAEMRAVTDSW